jgi:hypothetical protein
VVLVPYRPAWRYGLEGERMAWYESPVMVRQGENEPWAEVFKRAKAKAKELCADLRELPATEQAAA